jgi:hypothetical protein
MGYLPKTTKIQGIPVAVPAGGDDGEFARFNSAAGGTITWEAATGGTGGATFTDLYASRPAAGTDGDLFFPSDGFVVERDDGANWIPWGPLHPFTAPDIGDFSWYNQGTGSYDTVPGGIYILAPAQGGGEAPRMLDIATPTPPYIITAHLTALGFPADYWAAGMRIRDSVGLKSVALNFGYNSGSGGLVFSLDKFNADLTYNSTYGTYPTFGNGYNWAVPPRFFQLEDDATNRIWRLSSDGYHWLTGHSVGRTDWITPDRVGFFANSINASHDCGALLLSWRVET